MNFGGLGGAVLLPKMSVSLHRKRATVRVPEPSRDRRNIDSRLDAACREKMPEIMMIDRLQADRLARRFWRTKGTCVEIAVIRATFR